MSTHTSDTTLEKIVSLCKRRGFVYPSAEIHMFVLLITNHSYCIHACNLLLNNLAKSSPSCVVFLCCGIWLLMILHWISNICWQKCKRRHIKIKKSIPSYIPNMDQIITSNNNNNNGEGIDNKKQQ